MYTNSPLVSYTKLSPNFTPGRRYGKIDTVTIHCVVGQCTVEALGAVFANPQRQASSNYGIGYNGRIGMYVEEKNESWCSSNRDNDARAITIEVASDTFHPYAVTENAYNALLDLLTDICKRNNIKQLLWKADKSLIGQPEKQNMTVHRWFAAVQCPGEYLYSRYGKIAEEVNKRLGTVPAYTIKAGDTVRIVGNTYTNGATIPQYIKNQTHVVAQISGDKALLGYPSGICSWVPLDGLELVKSAVIEPPKYNEPAPEPPAPAKPTAVDKAIAKGIISASDNLNASVSKQDVINMLDKLGLI